MKRTLLSIAVVISFLPALANHITGGEMSYVFQGIDTAGNYRYRITLKLYRDCFSTGAQLDAAAPIAIFQRGPGGSFTMVWSRSVTQTNFVKLDLSAPGPCINNPPVVCYELGYYETLVSLPPSQYGYVVSYQRCCRIGGITNVTGSSSTGATYSAEIPGNQFLPNAPANNSAHFFGQDTVVVCAQNFFQYNFGATDADKDSLVYTFCSAFTGGSPGAPSPDPPDAPPYTPVPYAFPYTGGSPLGNAVTINRKTGLVSGTAPASGIYVVTVCVSEYRNGVLIATQRKDLQIKVADCTVAAANLDPEYITCDGYSWTFFNKSNSSLIKSYYWDFGVAGINTDTSTQAAPTYIFPDTGQFVVKVITNKGLLCPDSATTIMKVYPGFFPDFSSTGICLKNPVLFRDRTNTQYGVVDSWNWDFGVPNSATDVSQAQNPSFMYPDTGTYNIRFIVTNSKGCIDTVNKDITIIDKPPITLAFRDTLICVPDQVALNATGTGVFSWTPVGTIVSGGNTGTPVVNPVNTTTYQVSLDEQGCVNTDSVQVRVVRFVTLQAIPDTTICQGDEILLGANTDGLKFTWTALGPGGLVTNPSLLNATATTSSTTTYQILSEIGSCNAVDQVTVTAIPYPLANAGADTIICYNTDAQLHGSIVGTHFVWSPTQTLTNANTLDPIAHPQFTTSYVLTALDSLSGCPKPFYDTILVTSLPKINAFAGNDTAVVYGQPLQLFASGGEGYLWTPSTALSAVDISDPIAIYDGTIDSIRYKVYVYNEAGCADSATVLVKIFRTDPQIFVPTAFTPNGDGRNDLIRPIGVGIKQIEYFRIYNRWGQMVFETRVNGQGWDGKINGQDQATNTFVWIVKGVDYTDKPFFGKGTVTLIR